MALGLLLESHLSHHRVKSLRKEGLLIVSAIRQGCEPQIHTAQIHTPQIRLL